MSRLARALPVLAMAIGGSLAAQMAPPVLPFETDADALKMPNDIYIGEVAGVGSNSKGQIFATCEPATRTRPSATTARSPAADRDSSSSIRPASSSAARPGRLRVQRRDRTAHRSAGQRVDDRRRGESSGQVRSRRTNRPRARPQTGSDRRPAGAAARGARRRGRRSSSGRGSAAAAAPPASGSGTRRRVWNTGVELHSTGRRRLGSRRQHLRGRRHWQQQSCREVRQGRTLHRALGLDRLRPRPVHGVKALAIDARDNLYVADRGNKRIQVFDLSGTFNSEFGGVGTPSRCA